MKIKLCSALLLALAACAAAPAYATDVHQEEAGNATSVCHTALPQFDNPIRFRPLAVANEGTTPSFVTCSLVSPTNSQGQEYMAAVLSNHNASGVITITCTAVMGVDDGQAVYMTRNKSVPAGGRESLRWAYDTDNGGTRWQTRLNMSCALPPGGELNEIKQGYTQL